MQVILEKSFLDDLILKIETVYKAVSNNKSEEKQSQWMSGSEVMEMLQICPRTLQNYRDTGKIGFSQIGKKKIHYSRESVEKLLSGSYVKPFNLKQI